MILSRSPAPGGLLVAAGTLASAGVVVGATGAGPIRGVTAPAGPWGLWDPADAGRGWFAALTAVSVCVLCLMFVRLHRQAAGGSLGLRGVVVAATAWTLPVLPGPPLMSLDVYSYAAQGAMVSAGLDPYSTGPDRLGGPLLEAVAPTWRHTPAPYGPLSLALLTRVVDLADADLPTTVYLLRLAAVAGVLAAALAVVRLAAPDRRPAALALVAANPLVTLHLIGGVHLDALLTGLAAVCVLAVHRRRWTTAALLAATAFAFKAPGLVLVGYVLLRRARAGGADTWKTAGTALVAGAAILGYASLVPNGWGWIAALDTPGLVRHPYDPGTIVGWLIHAGTLVTADPLALTPAVRVARTVIMLAGALAVALLLWRAADNARTARDAGGALTVVALAAPTVHAWYLGWDLAPMAAGATDRAHRWMVGMSVALCFTALPDQLLHRPSGLALILGLLAAALSGLFPIALPHRRITTPGRRLAHDGAAAARTPTTRATSRRV